MSLPRAPKVHAQRDLTIDADNQIQVGVQKTANAKAVRDDKTSWGGIGGGDNKTTATAARSATPPS